MSILRLVSFDRYCDQCKRTFGDVGNEPYSLPGEAGEETIPAVRRIMHKYGWVTRRKKIDWLIDLCPTCAEKEGQL